MKDLFRKEAVDNFKNQFITDKRLAKISFSSIIMVALFVIGLKLFSVWFFYGVVINSINVRGVVYPSEKMEQVYSPTSGVVSNINILPGESVKKGDVLAVIPDESILSNLTVSEETPHREQDTYNLNKDDYIQNSFIRSMSNGTVISTIQEGSFVQKGDTIATIAVEHPGFDKDNIILFLPTEKKSNVDEGDSVQISPNYAKREKYGYIKGHIYQIGSEIITRDRALKEYNYYNIPNLLDENITYVPVYITLEKDDNTKSGIAWSQSSSEHIYPELGTLCDCSIISDEQTPFQCLLGGG